MQLQRVKKITACALLVFLIRVADSVEAEQLPIKTYTTADGLPRDAVSCITRDSRGFLWFGTYEGLSRYDGYKFNNYTTADGLPHRSVREVLESRGGEIWIATPDGVCRLNPRGRRLNNRESAIRRPKYPLNASPDPLFSVYYPGGGPARDVRALFEDSTGTIWCGTADGVYQLDQESGEVTFKSVEIGLPSKPGDDRIIECFLEDRQGSCWIGTRGSGLYRRWPDGRIEHLGARQALSDHINALLEDRDGRLWIGTTDGLCLIVGEPHSNRAVVGRRYTTKDGLPSNWINALLQSFDGNLWIGTTRGLSEFQPSKEGIDKFRNYATAHGLSHEEINTLAEDHHGNLWIGTTYGGAMKLARSGFVTYRGEADGLSIPYLAASIFETRRGELCLAEKNLIRAFDGQRFIATQPNFPKYITYFGWGWYQLTLEDRAGEWWVPTGQGLCRFPKVSRIADLAHTRAKAIYTTKDGLISDDIFRIFEDSRGDVWIGAWPSATRAGLTRWERATETLHTYTESDGLPPPIWTAHAFGEDASGNVWVAVGGSLARYAMGRFRIFTTADGVPAGAIAAVYRDQSGRLWIASDSGGLGRIDDPSAEHPRFIIYTMAEGLSGNQISSAITEDRGNIYVGTGRGIDRLNPETGKIRHYTTADGLAGSQPIFAFRDRNGTLWFSAAQGLSRLIPEPDPPPSQPLILISGLRIAGETYPISEVGETDVPELELGPGDIQIQIDFVGLSFATAEALRYQYKLEGVDADWSAPIDQRSVNYASLSAGKYRFLVRAINADGALSENPATVAFTVLPPIWQRWWFLLAAVTVIGFTVYSAYRYRVGRLLELERVRTRIAADLHDDIGASLSRMAILSEVVKRDVGETAHQSTPMLTEIADSARGLVGSMRDIVWAIDPRRDDLGSVIFRIRQFASDLLEGRGIKWEFHTPPGLEEIKLGPDHRRNIFLFFKEAINNVARHADCNAAWITIDVAHNQLIGEVRDDGRGFAPASVQQISKDGRSGHGLENMERRVSQLHGTLTINSSPGQGTQLKVTIPLKKP